VKQRLRQRIGILGGGQLGKMLCQAGSRLGLDLHILEQDPACPASAVCNQVVTGSVNNFDDVVSFGRRMDIVTIEIENVSVDALLQLEREGIRVYPGSSAMGIIRDKGLQKEFYSRIGIPTAPYQLFADSESVRKAVNENAITYPFVQKSRKDGYDGKGVHIVRTASDLDRLLEGPCLIEDLVAIDKEIAVIVARDVEGKTAVYPLVEMQFHPTANLVEFLLSPSAIPSHLEESAVVSAKMLAEELGIVGLLAVEMFVSAEGQLFVNEVAPRPHNSGHHTIEACGVSQYEMHLRALLGLPLGDTRLRCPVVMTNLLGEPGFEGVALYQGLEECLALPGVYPHIYGKKMTKPLRKMGHVTITGETLEAAMQKAAFVTKTIKVIS
jgi:5-(carboxyamino)imidazole ribonucleotide synthase